MALTLLAYVSLFMSGVLDPVFEAASRVSPLFALILMVIPWTFLIIAPYFALNYYLARQNPTYASTSKLAQHPGKSISGMVLGLAALSILGLAVIWMIVGYVASRSA